MKKLDLSSNRNGSIKSPSLIEVFFAGVMTLFATLAHAEPEFVQSQANFEKAIRNMSTSTYIVFATVVNDNTGEMHAECMAAPFLLGAIHKEYDLDYDASSIENAIQVVLTNPSRIFHFSKQAAIDNLLSFKKEEKWRDQQHRYQQACTLVKRGKSVFLSDRGGQILADP